MAEPFESTTFAEQTEKVVATINEKRDELKAIGGFTDDQIDALIATMRLEAQLGVKLMDLEEDPDDITPAGGTA